MLHRFLRQDSGSVMTSAAILFPVALGAASAMVDYNRTLNTRSAAQEALDAAVLAVARSEDLNGDIQNFGSQFFDAILEKGSSTGFPTQSNFVFDGALIRGNATVTTPTPLLGIFMEGSIDVNVTAAAMPPTSAPPIEISIVLDTSGSMTAVDETSPDAETVTTVDETTGETTTTTTGSSRFTNAVTAAKELVEDILAVNPNNAHIAIVPYGSSVPVNPQQYGNVLAQTSLTGNPAPASGDTSVRVTPVERYGDGAYNDRSPSVYPLEFVSSGDTYEVTAADGTVSNRAYTYTHAFEPKPLSNDKTALLEYLDGLHASGSTVGHMGFMWGWWAISPNWSAYWSLENNRPRPYGTTRKVMILLTDGYFHTPIRQDLGTMEANAGGNNAAAVVEYFKKACDEARQSGVEIFTIRYVNGDSAALQACAGDESRYIAAQNYGELFGAFETAGTGIIGEGVAIPRLVN